jgi:hypothetical protein
VNQQFFAALDLSKNSLHVCEISQFKFEYWDPKDTQTYFIGK